MTSSSRMQPNETQLTSQRQDPTLASLTKKSGCTIVSLPQENAKATVTALFDLYRIEEIHVWTAAEAPADVFLAESEWCIAFPYTTQWEKHVGSFLLLPLAEKRTTLFFAGQLWVGLVYPENALQMLPRRANHALEALDVAKMNAVPAGEVPAPWVAPDIPTDALFRRGAVEAHAVQVDSPADLPQLSPIEESALPPIVSDEDITQVFDSILDHLQLPSFPLLLRRGNVPKRGFVTGQVCFSRDMVPLRMALTTCPNADLAEVVATLVHEFTHLLVPRDAHGRKFKQALIELAGALYGASYMQGALAHIDASYRVVDLWVAVGIRAALQHQAPPMPKAPEERAITKVVGQIQMLRAMAIDQAGRPEGINATAIANTKIALHGLEAYQVKLEQSIDDQMVDMWIDVGKRVAWRRQLMFGVVEYCHAFALSINTRGWMHLFGKHQHVVTAEYLYDICKEQIERRWEAHKVSWKEAQLAQGNRVTGGATRSEKTSFCQQAVRGLTEQMEAYRKGRDEEADRSLQPDQRAQVELRNAERFTEEQYRKRGLRWTGGTGESQRHNPSGYEAGRSIQFNVGIKSGTSGRKRLSSGKK